MDIRLATVNDAEELLRIYSPYVENTAVSFEYDVPSIDDFRNRIENTLMNYPYLVATEDGRIVGYAYAGSFHSRMAYKHSAELSIYIDKEFKRKGIGKALYSKLFEILKKQNIYSVHAGVAYTDRNDEYLTRDSLYFHENMGFVQTGKHTDCGYKFGRWYSLIWMDMEIAEKPETPKPFVLFSEVAVKI